MTTLTISDLSPADLAAVKALCKGHPKTEAQALRDLLRLGVLAARACESIAKETMDAPAEETL